MAIPLGIADIGLWLGNNTENSLDLEFRSTLDVTDIRWEEVTPSERRVLVKQLYERRAGITGSDLRLNSELPKQVDLDYYRRRADVLYLQKALSTSYYAVILQIGALALG